MANAETLEKAYAAIGSLRAKGHSQLDVGLVAKASGIARSTFYLDDDEWREVRAVIKGKASSRVKLVQVEVAKSSLATLQLEALSIRVAEAEEEVAHIQSVADRVYRELIDEVQKWFAKASQTPGKQARVAQIISELNSTRRELERLRGENQLLQARVDNSASLRPLVRKRIINLDTLNSPGETFANFLKQFEILLPQKSNGHGITAAYLLCGLPGSGKTSWIEAHEPSSPGGHLYVDSYAHTADFRRFVANRIRETTNAHIHCVWLRADDAICKERVSVMATGTSPILEETHIHQVKLSFEKPVFDEPFDSFILP